MAVTEFQSRILQLLVGSRIKHGESYIVRDLFRGSDEDLLAALAAAVLLGLGVVAWVGRGLFVMQLSVYDARSDFWEHAGVLRALMDSPLSPRNPHLDTADPSPRFMPLYVLVAIAASASVGVVFGFVPARRASR